MKNILLIDDDYEEYEIFSTALKSFSEEYICGYAKSCEQAIEQLQSSSPDVVFVDYNMPRQNGLDCVKQNRNLPGHSETCLVLYSNGMSDQMSKAASNAGVNFSFQKPDTDIGLQRIITMIYGFLIDENLV